LSGFWLGIAAALLAVAAGIAAFCKEIAARWRGIVVAHLFFLTLWMAIQVFFFATGAYWCLPGNSSRFVEWLTRSFAQVARCMPPTPSAFRATTAVAAQASPPAPVPAPAPVAARPPATVPASPQAPPPGAAAGTSPPPSPPASAVLAGSGTGWSPRTIANCWRNRAIGGGGCYENLADPPRRRPAPPPRYRYVERYPEPPPRLRPCRRAYDCWPDDSWPWRDDP
jgi:hypothetical protein